MRASKAFSLSLLMLGHSKLRSGLTIIGIIIGIAAVVSIISVSQGAQRNLQSQLSSLGVDVLTVSPGFSRAAGAGGGFAEGRSGGGQTGASSTKSVKNLTYKDVAVIRSIPNVKIVMGTLSGRASVNYLTQTASVSVRGVDSSAWKDIVTTDLASGRYLDQADTYSVVLGNRVATSIFQGGIQVNREILVSGKAFKVVGILKESGSDDSSVFMPIGMARDVITGAGKDDFSSISVKIANADLSNETVNSINSRLMAARGILSSKNQDFTVSSPAAFQQRVTSTLSSISLFLAAIAAISLIVGAVGIANTMFTSVLEKTEEIGIMKAIGAKNRDILSIFLLNSALLGLVGGVGGVLLGVVASSFISSLSSGASLGRLSLSSAYFSPSLIFGAFFLSMAVGMIAGAIPAYRASKLHPVEALRYE